MDSRKIITATRTSVWISIRICDPAFAFSSVEMATCDPNSIDLIVEDKCHDQCSTYEVVHVPSLEYNRIQQKRSTLPLFRTFRVLRSAIRQGNFICSQLHFSIAESYCRQLHNFHIDIVILQIQYGVSCSEMLGVLELQSFVLPHFLLNLGHSTVATPSRCDSHFVHYHT